MRRWPPILLLAVAFASIGPAGTARAADGGTRAAAGKGDIAIPLDEGKMRSPKNQDKNDQDVADVPPADSNAGDEGNDIYGRIAHGLTAQPDGGTAPAHGGGTAGPGGIEALPSVPELNGHPGGGAHPPGGTTGTPGGTGAPAAGTAGGTGTPAAGTPGAAGTPAGGTPGGALGQVHLNGGTPGAGATGTPGATAGATPDGGTPAAAGAGAPGEAATGTAPTLASSLDLPKETSAALLTHWAARRAALVAIDPVRAKAELTAILGLRKVLGIASLPGMSLALVREGRRDLKGGDKGAALAAAKTAVELAPDLAQPRWFLARARLAKKLTDLGPIFSASWAAMQRELASLPIRRATLGNLELSGLVGLVAASLAFLVLCLVGSARLFVHDFHHLFPSGVAPLQTGVLAVAILLAPLVLKLGIVVASVVAAAAVWLYLGRASKVVVALALGAIAATPFAVANVVKTTTFWGTPAADVWRIERTGSWQAPAARIAAKVRAGHASWQELFALGRYHEREGRLDEAKATFEKALLVHPNAAAIHTDLGATLYALGDLDGAKAELQKAIQLDNTDAAAYHDLAKIDFRHADLGPGQEARRRAVDLDPALVAAHPDSDSRLNVALAQARLSDADIAALAQKGKGLAATESELARRLSGVLPGRIAPFVPLGGLALLFVLGLVLGRLGPSRVCSKCGRPVCRRCDHDVGHGQLCGQCVNVFQKRGAVAPQARIAKELRIRRYQHWRVRLSRGVGVLLPGAGHVLLGRPVKGLVFLLLFAVGASALALWHGPVAQVFSPGRTIAPWRLVIFGALAGLTYLVALVSLIREDR